MVDGGVCFYAAARTDLYSITPFRQPPRDPVVPLSMYQNQGHSSGMLRSPSRAPGGVSGHQNPDGKISELSAIGAYTPVGCNLLRLHVNSWLKARMLLWKHF